MTKQKSTTNKAVEKYLPRIVQSIRDRENDEKQKELLRQLKATCARLTQKLSEFENRSKNDTEQCKLKPCPFCGSRATITKSVHPGFPDGIFTLDCRKCPVRIDQNYQCKTSLIKAWNRRPR